MKQDQITIGMQARVKIGSRLAPVTVERMIDRPGRRMQYQCLTGDTGRRITCTAARLRSSGPAPARPTMPAAAVVDAPTGPGVGTHGRSLTWADPVVGMVTSVRSAPVERLVGPNLAHVELVVGGVHVARSWRDACREVYSRIGTRRRLRAYPRPLRRGLWLAVAEAHAANRDMYRHVQGHGPIPSEEMIAAAMAGDAHACAAVLAR